MKVTLRELFLLTLAIGIAIGWYLDHRDLAGKVTEIRIRESFGGVTIKIEE